MKTTNRPAGQCHICGKRPVKMGYCDPCFNARQAEGYFDGSKEIRERRDEELKRKQNGRTTR